jgi:hypothetical protein
MLAAAARVSVRGSPSTTGRGPRLVAVPSVFPYQRAAQGARAGRPHLGGVVNVIGPTTGTRFRPRVAGDLAGRLWPPARWSFWISPASVKGRRWQRTSKPSCRTLPRSTATAAPPCVPTTMSWCSRWSVSRWIRRPRPSQQVSGQVVDRDNTKKATTRRSSAVCRPAVRRLRPHRRAVACRLERMSAWTLQREPMRSDSRRAVPIRPGWSWPC